MSQQKNDSPAFSLQKFGANEWKFVYPDALEPLIKHFDQAVQDLTLENAPQALKIFEAIKKQLPQYIDVYNIIALIHIWQKEYSEAIAVVEVGLEKIRTLIPDEFFEEQPLLEWSHPTNRPFLSCLTKLGLSLAFEKQYSDALEIFEQLIGMNPHDHQGVRGLLFWLYLEADWLDAAKDLCVYYKDDMLPALSYGYALVLYKQNNLEQAEAQLSAASEFFPSIAKALLHDPAVQHHHDFFALLEQPEDADVYVKNYGEFWHASKGALELLKKVM